MATNNMNLAKVELSNTFGNWLEAFNGNMDKIDMLPIPIEYGKNTTVEYLKFANGIIIFWGHFDHGTKYKCINTLVPGVSYASEYFTIDFPVALASTDMTLFTNAYDNRAVEIRIGLASSSYTSASFRYICPSAEDPAENRTKTCDILVIGDWK